MRKRVVITGLGCVSPVGNNVKETWDALLAGKSGAAPITGFDASNHKTKFAAEVKGFDALPFLGRAKLARWTASPNLPQLPPWKHWNIPD